MALWSVSMPRDGVAVATYSNPAMNYFTLEANRELGRLVEGWAADRSLRAVVLCGDGRSSGFITHFDVATLAAIASKPSAARNSALGSRAFHELVDGLSRLPQAVVVAMNGDTMGGGFELALAGDIRIGQRGDHRYGLPEARLGIMPGGGGTQRLARLVGAGRALELMLRARVVDPEEALQLGLVQFLADDAVSHAVDIAAEIAALPKVSVRSIKAAVYRGIEGPLALGLTVESGYYQETILSDASDELMAAYLAVPESERRSWLERRGPATAEESR
jgi:enoyl-CoA hydratase